ncbi:hypothetical protein QMK19_18935 [Streptomyces sp. H10-C2]|nr:MULTISPECIES: hypothetical protein [unclassified Streptomyces]MDJ0340856.1 hypothetical protein [Streptomyces sp. PH10-H1]MDJ0371696.1 hypothetical protein [Streptomyces sp. H10-C2]
MQRTRDEPFITETFDLGGPVTHEDIRAIRCSAFRLLPDDL